MEASLLKTLLDESDLRVYLKGDAIHIQVKSGSKVQNLLDYVSKRIDVGFSGQIYCWAFPGAIDKAVSLVEQIKSVWKSRSLLSSIYQCTRLFFHLTKSHVEQYHVKSNEPAMGVILSLQVFIENHSNQPNSSLILTTKEEIPAVVKPLPSRRKKRHQVKKRRPDNFQCNSPSDPRNKNAKNYKIRNSDQHGKDTEVVMFDTCHRLTHSQKLSKLSATSALKRKDSN